MTVKYIKYAPIKSSIVENSALNDNSAISNWEISQTFSLIDTTLTIGKGMESFSYPDKKLQPLLKWETVTTDYDGILNISKYRNNKDKKGNTNFIVAKTNIVSNQDKTIQLQFGFCDIAAVYINGKYVFSGFVPLIDNKKYIRGSMNNIFEINLFAGNNELLVVTSGYDNEGKDGGWGILTKIMNR